MGRWTVKRQEQRSKIHHLLNCHAKRKKKKGVLWGGDKSGIGTFWLSDLSSAVHWCACFLHKQKVGFFHA